MRKMRNVLKLAAVLFIVAVFAVPAAAIHASGEDVPDEFIPYSEQLDANGKAIYEALNSAEPDVRTMVVDLPVVLTAKSSDPDEARDFVTDLVKDSIKEAFVAMRLGSPLAFLAWTPTTVQYDIDMTVLGDTATATSITFKIDYVNYPKDPKTGEFQGIEKMLEDINAAVDKFHTDGKTARDKVQDINNYIVNLATYDPNMGGKDESRFSHDVYGVFVDPKHYAVCDGYSKAFLLLCEKEGIECVVVLGTSLPNLVNHAWNYVKMDDGKWYGMDVTWNDGKGNPYFLSGGDTFFLSHHQGVFLTAADLSPYPFNSPTLSKTKYDKDSEWNKIYTWILAAAIVAIISAVLYRYARRNG